MPFQTVKDPQTGEERRIYVAPQGMGNAPAPAPKPKAQTQPKPASKPRPQSYGLSDTIAGQLLSPFGAAIGAGVAEFQRSGDLGRALGAAGQASNEELEKPGSGRAILRTGSNAMRNALQETSDAVLYDAPQALGLRKQSSSDFGGDAPFLGIRPALPKLKSSGPAEDLVTGVVQAGVGWVTGTRAVNLLGKGLSMAPGASQVGQGLAAVQKAAASTKVAQAAAKVPGAAVVGKAVVNNTLTKGAATGALVDVVAFDQHGGRLTDLIDQATKGTPFNALAIDYLKSDPSDVGMEGRLKNALEGGLFGTALETALRTMRVARNVNWFRRAPEAEKPAAEQAVRKATQDLELEIARQSYTIPDVGPELSVSVPGQAPAPRDLQPPMVQDVAEINPQEVIAAPQVMQFKEAGRGTKSGASGSLSGSSGFNPLLGGIVSVWRDVNGQLGERGLVYVVNGHNRLKLAKDSEYDKILVRFLDAPTAEDARALGALQNIAEGQGTPVDAAKFMRDTGRTVEDMAAANVNLSGPVAAQAIPLSRLPQNLFDKVATGQLDLAKATALGSVDGLDGQVINDVAAEAAKRKWSAAKIEQAMQEAKFATTSVADDDGGLLAILGEQWASKTSNFNQLLDIRTEAYSKLREEMVALTSAARAGRRGILEAAGNVIDVEGSQAMRSQAQMAAAVFNKVTGYTGPVRDLLNELAGLVKGKITAKQVVTENLDRLRTAIQEEINGPRLPLEDAAAPEPSVPSAGSSTPAQAAETKALMDRVVDALPPEKRAAVQAEIERRAQEPAAPTGGIDIPAAASRKITARTSDSRIQSAAESLASWTTKAGGKPMPMDQALELVRAKGSILDPDKIPGLDMDAARADKTKGAVDTPATEAAASAYRQFYGIDSPAAAAPASTQAPTFSLPAELQRSAPRYGMATINFASDLDRAAYVLANDAVKPSKAAPKFRQAVEDAGLDVAEVVAHGRKVKQAIKDAAGGGAAPKRAMQLDIADQGFGNRGALASYEVFQPDPNQRRLDPEFIQSFTKELTEDMRRVAGDDVVIRYQQAFEMQQRAKEWGGTGDPKDISYVNGKYDPIEDLIQLNGIGTKGIANLRQTAFHEAFHRVQFNFLTEQELKALNSFWGQMKVGYGADATVKAVAKQGRKVSLIEQQAIAFQRYAYAKKEGLDVLGYMAGAPESELFGTRVAGADAQGRPIYRDATGKEQLITDAMLKGIGIMDTLLDFIEKANNFFRGRGWTSTKSIFEQAYSGKLAETRQDLGNAYEDYGARAYILDSIRDTDIVPLGGKDNRARGQLYSEGPTGPTAAEIEELDNTLAMARADLSPQQRVALRNQLLQQRYEPTMTTPPEGVDLPPQAGREEPTAQEPLTVDEGQVDEGAGSPPEPPAPPPTVVEPPPIDDDWARRLVDQIERQRQALEDGTVTIEDLLANNVQKFQSPSGRTAYVPSAPTNAVQAYRAFSDVFTRAEATGIPVMNFEKVQADTEAWLSKNSYDGQAVLEGLKQLSGPLGNYQENLVALRAAQLYADHTNLQAGIAANKWLNAGADETADMGQLTAELLTAAAQQKAANTALESVTRPIGQLLYSLQNPRPRPGDVPFNGPGKNIGEELDQALEQQAQTPVTESVGRPLSPEAEEAITTGDYTPQVMAEMDQLARAMAQGATTPGFAKGFWKQVNESVAIGARGLVIYRAAQLLSSGLTLFSNALGGSIRLVQMPLSQAMGAAMKGELGRASQSLLLYGQYVSNLQNALRLGVESFKAGRGLYDLDETSVDFLDRLVKEDAQERLLPGAQAKGEWDLNTMPWLDVQDKSNWAIAQRRIWQLLNLSTRTQVSLDTFYKTLAGQSFEYVRNIQPGLDRAIQQGLEPGSKEAWSFARDYAQAAVDRATRDVVIDGRTILDSVMTSPDAQTAMRYVTFTDDIWAQMGPRTYQGGLQLAEARGLKDAEAEEFARKYMQTAEDVPGFSRTFSMLPAAWQKLIDFSPLFSIVQPFNRTPGDIVKSAVRMTPAAPMVDTFWRDINSEDLLTRDRARGDVALGAAAISLATIAITNGRVEFTGGGPANPEAQKKWRDSGKQPYSFRVRLGDNEDGSPQFSPYVSMRAFEPFSSLFGAIADYQEIGNKLPKEARERLGSALTMDLVTAVAAGQLNKTYYQGFTELYEAFTGVGELDVGPNRVNPMERYISRIIASMIPASAALRAGRRIDDRTVRVSQPDELAEGGLGAMPMRLFQLTMGEIKNMIPGWSRELPPRRNWITGEPIVLSGVMGDQYLPPDQPWLAHLYQFALWSPIQIAPQVDPVLMEMAKLSGKGANFRGPTNTDFGREFRLSPTKFDEYTLTVADARDQYGRTVHQALEQLINSDFYKSLPDEEISTMVMSQKAAAIDLEVQKFRQLGKEMFLGKNPEIRRNMQGVEGLNKDVQYRLKYGQPIDVPGFVEGLR